MSFMKRLLSGDYRRGIAAEAAGNYAEAASAYALAGAREKVAMMHLCIAERADKLQGEIAALRDALRWADPETEVRRRVARSLGQAILRRGRAEGVATARDRAEVKEAATLLEEAGELREAGEAWESIGEDDDAARAYQKGGIVDKMELALARDDQKARTARRVRAAFEEYELHWQGGDRESALSALRLACDVAEEKAEYRRLMEDLEARRIVSGRVSLRRLPKGEIVALSGSGRATLGREASCDLVLRQAGVSRAHVSVAADDAGFRAKDAGSRHGTWVGGIPIEGEVELKVDGRLSLGQDCELSWAQRGSRLVLEVVRGMDRGARLVVAVPGALVPLSDLNVPAEVRFVDGRPYLTNVDGGTLRLNGNRLTSGPVQLVRGDALAWADVELEVL